MLTYIVVSSPTLVREPAVVSASVADRLQNNFNCFRFSDPSATPPYLLALILVSFFSLSLAACERAPMYLFVTERCVRPWFINLRGFRQLLCLYGYACTWCLCLREPPTPYIFERLVGLFSSSFVSDVFTTNRRQPVQHIPVNPFLRSSWPFPLVASIFY